MPTNLDSLFGDEIPGVEPVALSDDLRRVLRLPQRDALPVAEAIAEPLSRRLRAPGGTMSLRPLQALALAEAHDLRGLLALLPVGEGKTLITFLLPAVLGLARAVLLIPAALRDKTERDFAALSKHWKGTPPIVLSYELISTRPELLASHDPDLVIADEVDALKNPKAACTRRVHRYLRTRAKCERPVVFCGLSGTVASRSFRDWWHIQQWALPPLVQPLPYSWPVMQSWSQALDEKLTQRRPTGELWRLVDEHIPRASVIQIREAFGRRLRRVPGIITADGSHVGASIRVKRTRWRIPAIEQALDAMRRTWTTPGGEEFSEASDLWRHAREIANGFYYRWDPEPPEWWLEPRRVFHAFVRSVLSGSRTLDTMAQVVAAHPERSEIRAWYDVKDAYTPNTVAEWFCDDVLARAAKFDGLVWVEHRAVGARLEQAFGLPYFGEGGLDSRGAFIEAHGGKPAAVSALACFRGFNLQHEWSRNLILNTPPVGKHLEQMLGRTHRFGQLADVVEVEVLETADEQSAGFDQAIADAHYIQQTTGQRQKLCFADYV